MMDLLELQLSEVDLLRSMFPGNGEFHMDFPVILEDVQRYIDGKREARPKNITFTLTLIITGSEQTHSAELVCSFPSEYPNILPDIFLRSQELSRSQQKKLNEELLNYLKEMVVEGELCINTAIIWIQEYSLGYFEQSLSEMPQRDEAKVKQKYTGMSRLWIYSHHIYRKELLKKIPELAMELDLTGFCLPGKPGIICVEGMKENSDEYWQKLKYPNWKHISCKHREDLDFKDNVSVQEQLSSFRLFMDFEELAFEAHGDFGLRNDYHMDLGQFRHYLKEHKCHHIFNIFFGLQSKSPTERSDSGSE